MKYLWSLNPSSTGLFLVTCLTSGGGDPTFSENVGILEGVFSNGPCK